MVVNDLLVFEIFQFYHKKYLFIEIVIFSMRDTAFHHVGENSVHSDQPADLDQHCFKKKSVR